MSYDLWGQLLGKARRRQLEGTVKVAAGPLLAQVGGGLLTAAAVSHFGPGAASLVSAAIGGTLKFGPPSGLMTPVAPGTVPLIPALVQAVSTLANKPKAAAQAKQKSLADQAAQAAQAQAELILNAQQEDEVKRRAAWEAEAEQIAEAAAAAVLEKYFERTGKFNRSDLGKVDAVIGEAETVAEELPQTGVVAKVGEALHAAEEFVAGVITKTEEAGAEQEATP